MPKLVDHDHFREKLMESCFSIFSQKGYSKTSIREIAKETETSTGTLYHYSIQTAKMLVTYLTGFVLTSLFTPGIFSIR